MTPSKGADEQERAALADAFGQQMVEPGDGMIDFGPIDEQPPIDDDDGDDESWEDDPAIEAITAGLRDIMDARWVL